MTALWLLAPQTPMFFQGQEFASSAPFVFFADNSGEQAEQVARGRAKFLSQFPSLATPEAQKRLLPPHERSTFERCKLDFTERDRHRPTYILHIDLLRLRRDDPVFSRQETDQLDGLALSADSLVVRYFSDDAGDRLLLVNFGRDLTLSPLPQPLLAPPPESAWELLWHSDSDRYGGRGAAPLEVAGRWTIPGETAAVMKAVPRPAASQTRDEDQPQS
jgi:maltooligosyltrehalose trehalohydrolase